jgi:Tol biopolymer transport system component
MNATLYSKNLLPTAAATTALAMLVVCISFSAEAKAQNTGTFLLNRIGPVTSELYVANANGTSERKLIPTTGYDYHASFSKDGQWIVFTSERDGLGQSEIYRVKVDGTGLQRLTTHVAVDDAAVFSPTDPDTIAFVSSRSGSAGFGTANIWTLKISTGVLKNVTGALAFDATKPHGYFRPSWSADGKWLAFSSDTGTDWRGHNLPDGWERTQETSIYIIRPDGTGLKKIATNPGYADGSPSWSPDGASVVFYETPVESTWGAHRPELISTISSQLVSVDVNTLARTTLTSGSGLKVFPQYLSASNIAYHVKAGSSEGIYTTAGTSIATSGTGIRSPRFAADGTQMVYEKVAFSPARANGLALYSFDAGWAYKYTDVFPQLSRDYQKLVYTEKAINSSIAIVNPDFTGYTRIYDPATSGVDATLIKQGLAGAFQPTWSPDRQWVAFGVGQWFLTRAAGPGKIVRIKADGSMNGVAESLTDGSVNSGFPSYSPDGKKLVYRVWSPTEKGLRILDLTTRSTTTLTTEPDNTPGWSPDGAKIVFVRKQIDASDPNKFNYDVFTIKPDGTNLKRLTTAGGNDAHAVWTWDGRLLYSSASNGHKDELSLYDNTFQPDGQNWLMDADGSHQRQLTDTLWEEAMPLYIPKK